MVDFQLSRISDADVDAVISADIEFDGNISFDKNLQIFGKIVGQINATGDLFIEEGAEINATVIADKVVVKGTINGNVYAYDRVEIFSNAVVKGDIIAGNFIKDSGSQFKGKCEEMSRREVIKRVRSDLNVEPMIEQIESEKSIAGNSNVIVDGKKFRE